MTPAERTHRKHRLNDDGFDVTCVIGRVEFSDNGTDDPYECAFRLIGHHHAPGTFTFPGAGGNDVSVTVEYELNE